MKITYAPNPLFTTIELDEHEKQLLRLTIKIKELEELMFEAWFHSDNVKYLDLVRAKEAVNPDYWCADDGASSKLDEAVDKTMFWVIAALQESHCGDCTCVPFSCSKCYAEGLIGIDTLKGIGKHSIHKIDSAFGRENNRTLAEAIDSLSNYNPKVTDAGVDPGWAKNVEGFKEYLPGWKKEAEVAATWLRDYRDTHFKEQS